METSAGYLEKNFPKNIYSLLKKECDLLTYAKDGYFE